MKRNDLTHPIILQYFYQKSKSVNQIFSFIKKKHVSSMNLFWGFKMRKFLLATVLGCVLVFPSFAQMMDVPATPDLPHEMSKDDLDNLVIQKITEKISKTGHCFSVWVGVSRLDGIAGVMLMSLHKPETDVVGKQFLHDALVGTQKISEVADPVFQNIMKDIQDAKLPIRQDQLENLMLAATRSGNIKNLNDLVQYTLNLPDSAATDRDLRKESLECDSYIEKMIGHSPNNLTEPLPDLDYSKF